MFPDNRIRELRKKARMTQGELGHMVGLHQTQIGNIENGSRNLTIEWARRIARALNVATVELLGEADNPYRLSEAERELLERFRAAPSNQQALIHRVAEPVTSFTSEDQDERRAVA